MRDISEDPDFTVCIWGNNEQIDLRNHGRMGEIKPIEFHVKEDGAFDKDGNSVSSFCFVLIDGKNGDKYCAQISEHMMSPALKEMGYIKE